VSYIQYCAPYVSGRVWETSRFVATVRTFDVSGWRTRAVLVAGPSAVAGELAA
jgi:hypothetical protein